jgi:benzoyl-CoA 2,3-dioxygenase component B
MCRLKTDDPATVRAAGVIDLPTLQRYINFHYSVSLDLFGQEVSTNAANYYTAGLKGRFHETDINDDHKLVDAIYPVTCLEGEAIRLRDQPALTAVNERLRDDYVNDCQRGVDRWNKVIRKYGIDFELKLPHRAFHRRIGAFSGIKVSPDGRIITEADWTHHATGWMPNEHDRAFILSLMGKAVIEPGKMANWIAPPARGINGQPIDFAYVRFN